MPERVDQHHDQVILAALPDSWHARSALWTKSTRSSGRAPIAAALFFHFRGSDGSHHGVQFADHFVERLLDCRAVLS